MFCIETYGGLFLSTQYCDTYSGLASQGQELAANTWTLYGLWPDFSMVRIPGLNSYVPLRPPFGQASNKPDCGQIQRPTVIDVYRF